jgi:uncharacterized membrane protein HdeD (DUF308 family)
MFSQLRDSLSMTLVGLLLAAGVVVFAVVSLRLGLAKTGREWSAVIGALGVAAKVVHSLVAERSD